MSELLDKQVNAQKRQTSWVHINSRKPTKKVCDENERNKQRRKKQRMRKNVIHGRKPFITPIQRTGENDLEPRGNDYGYIEGTICLVSRLIGSKGMVFERGCTNRRHYTRIGWYSGLVAPISSIVELLILYG